MAYKNKEDRKAYWKKWYAENKKHHIANQKKVRQRIRQLIISSKEKPCADCGIQYPYYVMQYDHINGKKVDNLSAMVRGYGYNQVKAEIAKCDVVCANCHRIRIGKGNRRK